MQGKFVRTKWQIIGFQTNQDRTDIIQACILVSKGFGVFAGCLPRGHNIERKSEEREARRGG
jgi:hypothetical protein